MNDDTRGMHRIPDHQTSIKAACGIRRMTLREQVIVFADENPTFTDEDLRLSFPGKPESSLRKRRTELAQENVILNTGMTRFNEHDQEMIVWCHRDKWPGDKPPIIERDTTAKQSKVARLEARVADLEDMAALALPYVECAMDDDAYSIGGKLNIDKLVRRMRAALEPRSN